MSLGQVQPLNSVERAGTYGSNPGIRFLEKEKEATIEYAQTGKAHTPRVTGLRTGKFETTGDTHPNLHKALFLSKKHEHDNNTPQRKPSSFQLALGPTITEAFVNSYPNEMNRGNSAPPTLLSSKSEGTKILSQRTLSQTKLKTKTTPKNVNQPPKKISPPLPWECNGSNLDDINVSVQKFIAKVFKEQIDVDPSEKLPEKYLKDELDHFKKVLRLESIIKSVIYNIIKKKLISIEHGSDETANINPIHITEVNFKDIYSKTNITTVDDKLSELCIDIHKNKLSKITKHFPKNYIFRQETIKALLVITDTVFFNKHANKDVVLDHAIIKNQLIIDSNVLEKIDIDAEVVFHKYIAQISKKQNHLYKLWKRPIHNIKLINKNLMSQQKPSDKKQIKQFIVLRDTWKRIAEFGEKWLEEEKDPSAPPFQKIPSSHTPKIPETYTNQKFFTAYINYFFKDPDWKIVIATAVGSEQFAAAAVKKLNEVLNWRNSIKKIMRHTHKIIEPTNRILSIIPPEMFTSISRGNLDNPGASAYKSVIVQTNTKTGDSLTTKIKNRKTIVRISNGEIIKTWEPSRLWYEKIILALNRNGYGDKEWTLGEITEMLNHVYGYENLLKEVFFTPHTYELSYKHFNLFLEHKFGKFLEFISKPPPPPGINVDDIIKNKKKTLLDSKSATRKVWEHIRLWYEKIVIALIQNGYGDHEWKLEEIKEMLNTVFDDENLHQKVVSLPHTNGAVSLPQIAELSYNHFKIFLQEKFSKEFQGTSFFTLSNPIDLAIENKTKVLMLTGATLANPEMKDVFDVDSSKFYGLALAIAEQANILEEGLLLSLSTSNLGLAKPSAKDEDSGEEGPKSTVPNDKGLSVSELHPAETLCDTENSNKLQQASLELSKMVAEAVNKILKKQILVCNSESKGFAKLPEELTIKLHIYLLIELHNHLLEKAPWFHVFQCMTINSIATAIQAFKDIHAPLFPEMPSLEADENSPGNKYILMTRPKKNTKTYGTIKVIGECFADIKPRTCFEFALGVLEKQKTVRGDMTSWHYRVRELPFGDLWIELSELMHKNGYLFHTKNRNLNFYPLDEEFSKHQSKANEQKEFILRTLKNVKKYWKEKIKEEAKKEANQRNVEQIGEDIIIKLKGGAEVVLFKKDKTPPEIHTKNFALFSAMSFSEVSASTSSDDYTKGKLKAESVHDLVV